jgi:peroxiredoxin
MLAAAGFYNLAWGLFVIAEPLAFFRWFQFSPLPNYPELWQCMGMVIGVYGIGYLIASTDPVRHWPIVLVGFLGKIFGPIGFVWTAAQGKLPWSFGALLLTNDLIWWIPFARVLCDAWKCHQRMLPMSSSTPADALPWTDFPAVSGRTLGQISEARPTLLVFLRHSGCTFCREALADLRDRRSEIEARGTQIAIVYQESPEGMRPLLERQGLSDVEQFSDPDRRLYDAFELHLGTLGQLFNLSTFVRGFKAAITSRHGFGSISSNVYQMPGAFLVHRGRIVREFRHKTASDRPDYTALACPI